jgi:hypothetical protein
MSVSLSFDLTALQKFAQVVAVVLLLPGVVSAEGDIDGAGDVAAIRPNWSGPTSVVRTGLAMEVCVEPPLRRGLATHDPLFNTLGDLKGEFSRLSFWFPYPRLAVAELEPPAQGKTSWDFSLMDPIVVDFFKAAGGRPVWINFATIPEWMFKTPQRVPYPENPDQISWGYEKGSELRDPTFREVRDYFTRLVSWYTKGGFTDESGRRHESGYHFKFDVWEVLNEEDSEHHLSPELYTRIYDEVVGALRGVDPAMKFSGLALGHPEVKAAYFDYFLDPTHHKSGTPVDFISYHFYAQPEADESDETQQHTFFGQMDAYASDVRYIELLRKRLSPNTRTYIDELGTTTTDNFSLSVKIPDSYWSLSGAAFAYGYLAFARQQIDLVGGAELINYPGQVPGASLSDWKTGQPNARYRALKLLHDGIALGDRMVEIPELTLADVSNDPSLIPPRYYAAQAFTSPDGERKILVVNKRNRPLRIRIADGEGSHMDYVDVRTGDNPPASVKLQGDNVTLNGYAVAVIHLRR